MPWPLSPDTAYRQLVPFQYGRRAICASGAAELSGKRAFTLFICLPGTAHAIVVACRGLSFRRRDGKPANS